MERQSKLAALPLLVTLRLALCAFTGCGAVMAAEPGFDHERVVGTDGAEIVLANPARLLAHRYDPYGWQYTAGGSLEERRGGHLLYFSTGGDGGFGVRVTDGQLRTREARHASASMTLRLRVEDDELLLDGGYAWPGEDSSELDDSLGFRLDVPSGHYAATVTAIDRPSDNSSRYLDVDDPEGPVADYVIQLREVRDVEDAPMMDGQPVLLPGESPSTRPFERMTTFEERCEGVPATAIFLPLREERLPEPGGYWTGAVPPALFEHARSTRRARDERSGLGFEFDPFDAADADIYFGDDSIALDLVIAPADTANSIGALVAVSGWSRSPSSDALSATTELSGAVPCAVRITGAVDPPGELASLAGAVAFVAIEPMPLDVKRSDETASDALVEAYTAWLGRSARGDARYRRAAIAEVADPRHRFIEIVRRSDPPTERLVEWLGAEAEARDRGLGAWLEGQP